MQIAGSAQPCAHVKLKLHPDEHWHLLVTQEFDAHSALSPQTAPAVFFVQRRSAPMAVHTFVWHTPFTVQTAPKGFPVHFLLEQMLEMQPAPVEQDEPLGNAARHTFCWLQSEGTESTSGNVSFSRTDFLVNTNLTFYSQVKHCVLQASAWSTFLQDIVQKVIRVL